MDTYGIPKYLEANPAVLTIATFPFFFGMMFGDMGHGSVLFFTAAVIVLFNESLKNVIPAPVMQARYLLMLMGLLAFYAGFIYNEFFAITTNLFGSCYKLNDAEPINQLEAYQL